MNQEEGYWLAVLIIKNTALSFHWQTDLSVQQSNIRAKRKIKDRPLLTGKKIAKVLLALVSRPFKKQ